MASSADVVKKIMRFKLQLTDSAESATVHTFYEIISAHKQRESAAMRDFGHTLFAVEIRFLSMFVMCCCSQ